MSKRKVTLDPKHPLGPVPIKCVALAEDTIISLEADQTLEKLARARQPEEFFRVARKEGVPEARLEAVWRLYE